MFAFIIILTTMIFLACAFGAFCLWLLELSVCAKNPLTGEANRWGMIWKKA